MAFLIYCCSSSSSSLKSAWKTLWGIPRNIVNKSKSLLSSGPVGGPSRMRKLPISRSRSWTKCTIPFSPHTVNIVPFPSGQSIGPSIALLEGSDMSGIRRCCNNHSPTTVLRGMELPQNFAHTRVDSDQPATADRFKCRNTVIPQGHFLDTSMGIYIGKSQLVAVNGWFLLLKSPHQDVGETSGPP
jgi:hypothetical protein